MVLTLSDLSNVKEMERRQKSSAHHDALTGLANRAQLYKFWMVSYPRVIIIQINSLPYFT